MAGERRARWSWGGASRLPPSVPRVDPLGWLVASAAVGLIFGGLVLLLLWRSLPALPLAPGSLGEHALRWLALAANAWSDRLFPEAARDYASFLSALTPQQRWGMWARCALAAAAGLAPFPLLARSMLRPGDALIDVRGARRLEGEDAKRALRAAVLADLKAGPDHEIAPGVAYAVQSWTRGVLIAGGVGSGKSTVLRPLIDQVVRSKERMLLFDAKSEFTSGWLGPAIIAPWDQRSLAWDIARDARNALEMENFAEGLIRESADPMWSSASRQILVGLMLSLRLRHGENWGWGELRDLLLLPQAGLLKAIGGLYPLASRAVADFNVTSAGILINLGSYCSPVFHLAAAWGAHPPERRVSIRAWALGRSAHPQLIIQGHGANRPLARAVAEGVIGVFSSLVASVEMDDDARAKIWFIADEAAQLGKAPLRDLFSMGRSRGLRCVMATQDFAQLEEIHGAQTVQSLLSMVGTLIIGQTMQGQTAEALCRAMGTRDVERPGPHVSGASGEGARPSLPSFSHQEVPLYKPSELGSRLGLSRDRKSITLILFANGVAHEIAWPLFPMQRRRRAHAPAAWAQAMPRAAPSVSVSGPTLLPRITHSGAHALDSLRSQQMADLAGAARSELHATDDDDWPFQARKGGGGADDAESDAPAAVSGSPFDFGPKR
jgi:hypothetical protein